MEIYNVNNNKEKSYFKSNLIIKVRYSYYQVKLSNFKFKT